MNHSILYDQGKGMKGSSPEPKFLAASQHQHNSASTLQEVLQAKELPPFIGVFFKYGLQACTFLTFKIPTCGGHS